MASTFHVRCDQNLIERLGASGRSIEGRIEYAHDDGYVHWHVRDSGIAVWMTHDGSVTINRSAGNIVLELEGYKMNELVMIDDVWRRLSDILRRGE